MANPARKGGGVRVTTPGHWSAHPRPYGRGSPSWLGLLRLLVLLLLLRLLRLGAAEEVAEEHAVGWGAIRSRNKQAVLANHEAQFRNGVLHRLQPRRQRQLAGHQVHRRRVEQLVLTRHSPH